MLQDTGQQVKIKKYGILYSVLGVLIFLILSGCVTTPEISGMRDNITNIRIEAMHQKREIDDIKGKLAEIDNIKDSVTEISKDVTMLKEHSLGAVQEGQVSLLLQIQELSRELQVLSGRFDENRYFMRMAMREVVSEKKLQQTRIASLEKEMENLKAKLSDIHPEPLEEEVRADIPQDFAEIGDAEVQAEVAHIDDPQRIYDDAQIDFEKALYGKARQGFKKFIRDFPAHALSPSAYFWIGETYYADGMYGDAILAHEDFLRRFPDHEKVAGARLKQAYAFVEIGDRRTSRVILERIIENHPNSSEAELAKRKIAEMFP